MITVTDEQKKLLMDLKNYEPETYYHSLRVKKLMYGLINISVRKGCVNYSDEIIEIICKGAMLHDIGKMNTNNKILTSREALSPEQKEVLRGHTSVGADMIEAYLEPEERQIIKTICLNHHERIDGGGYYGLTDIPDYIKLISICDVYDALTSDRVYRGGFDKDKALEMIENGECGSFDKWVIECLKEAIKNDR